MSDLREILLNKNVVVPKDYETFKDIFRHFKGKTVGDIKGDDGPLMDKAEEFYLKPPSANGFLQGDILENIPSTWIAKNDQGALAAFSAAGGYAMVLSSECDCEQRADGASQSFIRLCPILTQGEIMDATPEPKRNDVKGKLERNYYSEYFWMPAPSKTADPLVADFSHFFSISLSDLHEKTATGLAKRKASLSKEGHFLFLMKMAWFMLRPEGTDGERKNLAPWT